MRRPPTPVLISAGVFGCLLLVSMGAIELSAGTRLTKDDASHESSKPGMTPYPNPDVPGTFQGPNNIRPYGGWVAPQVPMVPLSPSLWPKPEQDKGKDEDDDGGLFSGIADAVSDFLTDDDETPKPSPSETPKSQLREGLEEIVPGLEQVPNWVLPIVARAEERKTPGTVVKVHMDAQGRAVISGTVLAQPGPKADSELTLVAYEEPILVNVTAVVEDPTNATPEEPAKVEVTVTNPETHESVTETAVITEPEKAAEVTEELTEQTVESAQAADVLTEAAPRDVPQEEPTPEATSEEPTPEPGPEAT